MIYPIAPKELTIAFSNARSFTSNTLSQQYSGGVREVGLGGINAVEDKWNLQLNVFYLTKYSTINTFIIERDGQPFRFDYDGNGVEDGSLYRIASHQWTWEAYQYWKLSVELKGVFRP